MIRSAKTIFASDPPLADTLRLMLPDAPTTLLLQAALLQGDAAGKAWSQWRQTVSDPKAFLASDRVGIKRHLPLLYRNLTNLDVDLGRDIEPYFRAARAREELRSARYRRFLGEALNALYQSGIEFVVGTGVTIGETLRADPVLRHSHDIDLLVRSQEIPAAADALRSAGFTSPLSHSPRSEKRFDHESGLPVELHDRLYRTPFYNGDLAGVWSRARAGNVVGIPVRLLGDTDLLVHTLVHASVVPQRCGLSWIVDVVSLLQQRNVEGTLIDWPQVTRLARQSHATLPMYVTCQYLGMTFKAAIPQNVMDELRRSAAKVGPLQHLAALDGVRADLRHRRLQAILDASRWRSRLAIARAMLLPPPEYLKAGHPDIGAMRLATLYFTRPLHFIARQARKIRNRLRKRVAPAQDFGAILPGNLPEPQGGN